MDNEKHIEVILAFDNKGKMFWGEFDSRKNLQKSVYCTPVANERLDDPNFQYACRLCFVVDDKTSNKVNNAPNESKMKLETPIEFTMD
jgi:hypothetical protein